MRIVTFKRGIHPNDKKQSTSSEAIQTLPLKPGSEFVFPMVQHLGAPCDPIVEVGEKVLLGQKIGESKAFVSSPVHTSVSGIVKEIRQTLTPTGITCKAVVVEYDGINEEHPTVGVIKDPDKMTREEMLAVVREAGIVGLGGAGFPTHIKLNPPPDKKIDTIIVNAAECEPYLTTDHRVLLEESEKIVRGAQIIQKIVPGAKCIIAIETNKMNAIKKMEALCAGIPDIEVVGLVPKYPQGAEKQLINACTGREVPSGGLPADIGCIVDNVDTVIAIQRAFDRGRPIMRKIVTVSGDAAVKPGNYKARLGMSYRELLEFAGGMKFEPYKMISGGPMMGVAMFSLDVPIIKTSSAILLFSKDEGLMPPEKNCFRCAKCVEHCPIGLMPLDLNYYVLSGDIDAFEKHNGLDCIECGSCSYVCPAKRHLAQSIRFARRERMAEKAAARAAKAAK